MESSRGFHWFFDGASARLAGRVVGVLAAAVLVPTMAQAAPPAVEVVTAAVKPQPVVSAADVRWHVSHTAKTWRTRPWRSAGVAAVNAGYGTRSYREQSW